MDGGDLPLEFAACRLLVRVEGMFRPAERWVFGNKPVPYPKVLGSPTADVAIAAFAIADVGNLTRRRAGPSLPGVGCATHAAGQVLASDRGGRRP